MRAALRFARRHRTKKILLLPGAGQTGWLPGRTIGQAWQTQAYSQPGSTRQARFLMAQAWRFALPQIFKPALLWPGAEPTGWLPGRICAAAMITIFIAAASLAQEPPLMARASCCAQQPRIKQVFIWAGTKPIGSLFGGTRVTRMIQE